VIGLGKLGAPMAAVTASKGHTVIGVDRDRKTVDALNDGRAPIYEPGLQELLDSLQPGQLMATTKLDDAIKASEMSIIIVPTPSLSDGSFDASGVVAIVTQIAQALAGQPTFHTVVIASTVMPGATGGMIAEALESTGLEVGHTVGLVYSPEFIALGSVIHDMLHHDLVLIGADHRSSAQHYRQFIKTLSSVKPLFMMTIEAEIAKLALNCYITTKISFANMLARMCTLYGADPHTVLRAIGQDSRIGNKYFKPGGPYGGPCFPRDGAALTRAAFIHGGSMPLVDATREINLQVIEEIVLGCVPYDTIAILGMTYKVGTNVTEESLGTRLADILKHKTIFTHDPMYNVSDPQDIVDQADCIVIATPWPAYKNLKFPWQDVLDPWNLLGG